MIPNGSPRIAASDPSNAAGPDAPDNHPVWLEPAESAPAGPVTGAAAGTLAVYRRSAVMAPPRAWAR
jgi:hypothetical protein